ncbi:GNAT family N-acetyltransferase [Pedobacter sp. SYSU D00535]|uniref:GNAT family N-acetyltransferase n=1 Tax=Pedobacter sp. SYSU D00535 TaxID=2810308 RepID=UPI001A9601D3|nr:GNAT family N-acetyltransferase [Pedobacter sp. SYSU D00535]
MIQIVTILEPEKWQKYVTSCSQYDFYHTWTYHSLNKCGEPFLFVFEEKELLVVFPLIKRKIYNTGLFDLTSVYGYSGPISDRALEKLSAAELKRFRDAFLDFLHEGNYVSVFSRLNPFFNQIPLLERLGGIHSNGEIVAIDLSSSYKDQAGKYRKNVSVAVKQLRQKGYQVKEASSIGEVATFIRIYTENMERLQAADQYYFDENYFLRFLSAEDYKSKLYLVYAGQEAISGTLVTFTNGIIQGHLIGTKAAYLSESPAKLLVDEVSIIGRELKMDFYHLGGGLGFKKDSLFHWKIGFSDYCLPYYSWRYIADRTAYKNLVSAHSLLDESTVDYFPLYRYEKVTK